MHDGDLGYDIADQSGCCLLEIYHENEWGTICDDTWETNENNANIACAQLGCSGGVYVTHTLLVFVPFDAAKS